MKSLSRIFSAFLSLALAAPALAGVVEVPGSQGSQGLGGGQAGASLGRAGGQSLSAPGSIDVRMGALPLLDAVRAETGETGGWNLIMEASALTPEAALDADPAVVALAVALKSNPTLSQAIAGQAAVAAVPSVSAAAAGVRSTPAYKQLLEALKGLSSRPQAADAGVLARSAVEALLSAAVSPSPTRLSGGVSLVDGSLLSAPLGGQYAPQASSQDAAAPGKAEDKPAKKGRGPEPLPAPDVVKSELASADQAFTKMYVSLPYESADPKAVPGDDLLARERGAIKAYIEDKSIPNRLKKIILTRYSINDLELARLMVEGVKAGVAVTLITDFNTSMDFEFKEDQKVITDFTLAQIKDNEAGIFLKTLMEGGVFKINDPKSLGAVYSQPLYNKGDAAMDPIMHEKTLILVTEADKAAGIERRVRFFFGTANLATNPRYNRVFESDEPMFAEFVLKHAGAVIAAFKEGKTIKEIESLPPLRVIYKDGSYVEIAFTNGRFNPNERQVKLLQRAAQTPKELVLEKVIQSQFVFTNGFVLDALKAAMLAQEGFKVYGVFDDKFISTRGYGKVGALDGFALLPEFGRTSYGWSRKLTDRTVLYGYQKGAEGVPETELEGPPTARTVWHDKTSAYFVVENGKRWVYVYTGSLNNSNHYDNAEMQVAIRFSADSAMAKALEESVMKVAEAEQAKGYAVPLEKAILRNTMARMIGHSPLEIPLKDLDAVEAALRAKDSAAVAEKLGALLAMGTTLTKDTIPAEQASDNIRRFAKFMDWYNVELPKKGSRKFPLTMQKAVAIAVVLAFPEVNRYTVKTALDTVLWVPNITEETKAAEIAEAMKVLELERTHAGLAEKPAEGGEKGK